MGASGGHPRGRTIVELEPVVIEGSWRSVCQRTVGKIWGWDGEHPGRAAGPWSCKLGCMVVVDKVFYETLSVPVFLSYT